MLAARIYGHGGNEVLRIDELAMPERNQGKVLIRMAAGGLNRVDFYMRNSGAGITHRPPIILGLDGAGVIVEADRNSAFRADDAVALYPGQPCETCELCRWSEEVLCTGGKSSASRSTGPSPNTSPRPSGRSHSN
jgi:NADPH:quinone reductase-like Zn-dependent oxidoreductase